MRCEPGFFCTLVLGNYIDKHKLKYHSKAFPIFTLISYRNIEVLIEELKLLETQTLDFLLLLSLNKLNIHIIIFEGNMPNCPFIQTFRIQIRIIQFY